uniref:Uncharacterized protein n=1 Tax=Arundo donax TaxID=35708 RepID=A0A0A9AS27_ARUDO
MSRRINLSLRRS